jgi:anaerobic magnesium-protoporphyrin IX monomethyl ester cyclase
MTNNLLIISPSSRKLYQKLQDNFSAKETNIWAGLLANSVRQHGFGVSIYDMEIETHSEKEFISEIESRNPDLILFVVTGQNPNASTAAMQGAVEAAEIIKNNLPNKLICFVGPHVNALPYETLQKHSFIDLVLTNEGVYSLRNLMRSSLKTSDFPTIKGIGYRDESGSIVINEAEGIVPQDLLHIDLPGVAYDLMPDLGRYRTSSWHANYIDEDRSPFASIYTSLGCIFKCEFCMINIINRTSNDLTKVSSDFSTFRYWDPNFTIKQLDYLASKGVKQLKIADEMWVLRPKHFEVLCDLIIERGYNFNIWAYSRIDTVKPQYLEKLKRAGVNWLALGIEAGNQNIRREITKGKFEDINIRDVMRMVHGAGINVVANYIVGLGTETWDTMQETLNLALELNAENSNIYCATPLPGSPLYRKAKNLNWQLPTNYSEYGFLSYDHIPSPTANLTSKEIVAFRDYAFTTLFTNPRFISMIGNKFGPKAVDNIKRMTNIPLERKILLEP